MIAQNVIDNIRSQTNIVDVISEFVTLKQKGHEHVAPCPFLDHADDQPSFSVNSVKQIYKCFGCGKGGGVFTFLMEYQRMTFTDAVKFCASRVGIKLEFDSSGSRDRLDLLSELHEKAAESFTAALSGREQYLLSQRQITAATIALYRLGFDDGKFKASVSSDYPSDLLFESGLFAKSQRGIIDRWTDRYTFPLIDLQGKVIAFAGTNNGADPKYVNSPETALYSKSMFLFGLYQARDAIVASKGVIITEGYFDCMSLVQAGFKNTVAVCGVALTTQHGKLLSRYCKDVVLLFDNNQAGNKAIDRSVSSLFEHGLTTYVAQCPAGDDPDDLVKAQGRDGVFEVLQGAENWFDFRLQYESPGEKMELVNKVKEIADEIESADRRSLFLDLCAEKLKIAREGLTSKGRVSYGTNTKLPELVLERSTELILLAGMHADPEFVVDRKVFDDERLTFLYDAIVAAKGDEAALYNSLSTEQSVRIMNAIVFMSVKDIDVESALNSVMKTSINRQIKILIEQIKQREHVDKDCTDLTVKLNDLIVQREGVLG